MAEDSNDLEAFFQKKNKKHKKRGGVQDVDAIGKRLDRNVRKQEELDKEEEERLQRTREQEQAQVGNEDSEWHEAEPRDIDLAAAGVKDMDLAEQDKDFDIQEEENPEKVKGWDIPNDQTKVETTNGLPEEPVEQAQQKYIPPSRLRAATTQKAAAPKLGDQEEFPSLGAAEEIEKIQEKARKRHEHFKMQEAGTIRPNENQKENEVDGFQQYHSNRGVAPATDSSASPTPAYQPKPGAYVPPHLRKLGQHQEGNRFESLQQE